MLLGIAIILLVISKLLGIWYRHKASVQWHLTFIVLTNVLTLGGLVIAFTH